MNGRDTFLTVGPSTAAARQLAATLEIRGDMAAQLEAVSRDEVVSLLSHRASEFKAVFLGECGESVVTSQVVAQLCSLTDSPIVVTVNDRRSPHLREFIRSGASDCIALDDHLPSDLALLIERMRRQSVGRSRRGRLVAVASSAGGCGASTVAANLAASLAGGARDTCLVDLHVAGGCLSNLLALQPLNSLADLCEYTTDLDSEVLAQSLCRHTSGVQLLASADLTKLPSRPPDVAKIDRILELAREMFSYSVIDLPDTLGPESTVAFEQCDVVMVVMRLDFPCIVRTKHVLDHLRRRGVASENIWLVANRYVNGCSLKPAKVIKALGTDITHYLPDDYATACLACNIGAPLVHDAPKTRLARAIQDIARSLPTPAEALTQ